MAKMAKDAALIINGWTLFAHPFFLEQLEALITEVEILQKKYPTLYKQKKSTKRLAAIQKLAFEVIPQNPAAPEYRQGDTLGEPYKHWFRAKFFQQYRLFYRFHSESKIIVYVWINDTETLRAYDSKTDAYAVFAKMLKSGKPPDNWDKLLKEAKKETTRLAKLKR